jgi:tungstate transport system substrate-binding protein
VRPPRLAAALMVAGALLSGGCGGDVAGASGEAILATTTSTRDSGLLDVLLPWFEEQTGCVVKPVAVGSGAALEMGRRGDVHVLLVHSPEEEEKFMLAGHGLSREPVMHNDFVIVGPPADPARVRGAGDAAEALSRVAEREATFASRGDGSGTHAKELALWDQAGVDPAGSWYVESGQGMGETLTIAGQKSAYTLADRGTFLATEGAGSTILFEGSRDLLNEYHVIVVGRGQPPTACAEELAVWLLEPAVQQRIGEFGVEEHGRPLFVPGAES